MVRKWFTIVAWAFAAGPLLVAPAVAQEARIIVKLRPEGAKSAMTPKARIAKAADSAGVAVRHVRAMALGADVVAVVGDGVAAEQVAQRIAASADVEFAEVDRPVHALQTAPVNDIFAAEQHYLRNDPTAISAFSAWEVTHGSTSVVVAVVDSGYRPHAAMAGRFLPGYDMVSDPLQANDGDGRDADATDPGDWVSASDAAGYFSGCEVTSSEWHGTGVAGIIGANTNDGNWTAGIDWNARLLPVRVLGKCGGSQSDVVDGIAWAAGLDVPGVPPNPTPAQVINVSLGGSGACPSIYRGLAAAAFARGVTRAIVAAAGNDAQDVANDSPASCPGFIPVASTTGVGGKLAAFSNFGTGIVLSAPGGSTNFRTPADSVIFLSNTGTTIPVDDTITNVGGTSVSAPMVSGTVSLMLAVAPWLTPDQVRSILVGTAKPFPLTSDCTTDRCGAGILDAGAAVRAAAATPPLTANYEGLWWNAPAGSEAGWGINVAHQGEVIFATWFTYAATGKAWWLSMTANQTAPNVFTGTLYQTHGPAFSAVPFAPSAVTATAVGTGTLTFSGNGSGTFAYTVNGITQSKSITREVFGPLPACTFGSPTPLAQATNYQDLWWAAPAGAESGWGVNFTQQGDVIFATWFTYDTDGSPLWLSATVNRSSPGTFTGTLYRTSGPAFSAVPFNPGQVVATPVGTLTLSFANGNSATFAYVVNGVSQSKAITRQILRAPGTMCQ